MHKCMEEHVCIHVVMYVHLCILHVDVCVNERAVYIDQHVKECEHVSEYIST